MQLSKDVLNDLHTVMDYVRYATSLLSRSDVYYGHGTDNALDEAVSLVLGSLHLPASLATEYWQGRLLADEKETIINNLARRIEDRIPVPYITNESWFMGMQFHVDERVLIPRSPIAELIREEFAPWVDPFDVDAVLDLCTGSGCIGIACATAFPDARVICSDISEGALTVAAKNVERFGLQEQVELVKSDVFAQIPEMPFDIIVSNPPYVGDEEMDTLPKEYAVEPDMALRAAEDGTAIAEQILRRAKHYLSDNGILVVEVGNAQWAMQARFPDVPFTWLEFEQGGEGVFLLTAEQVSEHF